MKELSTTIRDIIHHDFRAEQRERVIQELSSITLEHVMAASDYNLENTRLSILTLAKGDVDQLIRLTHLAKIDFRDVILWATRDH